jgi:hypothetical protein
MSNLGLNLFLKSSFKWYNIYITWLYIASLLNCQSWITKYEDVTYMTMEGLSNNLLLPCALFHFLFVNKNKGSTVHYKNKLIQLSPLRNNSYSSVQKLIAFRPRFSYLFPSSLIFFRWKVISPLLNLKTNETISFMFDLYFLTWQRTNACQTTATCTCFFLRGLQSTHWP